ncbi:hypothetical protein QBC44DRAFT_236869 [Cladorrhinum sp. PSN332]|nr:hypothetical protein QBC44DRAFT_236869 [Cladorrhinum sp. PSN332]
MSTTWAAPQQRKRGREEEFADISPGGTLGFTEHRSKRIQSLPLRTSPNSMRWPEPPRLPAQAPSFPPMHQQPRTITPGSSDSEDVVIEHCGWADEPELISQGPSSGMMVDCDMDMMDTSEPVPAQNDSHNFLAPGRFQNEPTGTSVSGRIPTPIHCTFASQIRGSNWNETHALPMQHIALATTPEEPTALAFCNNGMADMPVYEQRVANPQAVVDWSMVHVQNRPFPSPISESSKEDSPGMIVNSTPSAQNQGNHLSHLTHQHPLIAGLPHREATPGADSPNGDGDGMMEVESPGTPSPKRGHTRSRHTVNSWTTLQPGMKRSFSIGYRSDCEKCRMKVPGHFNHIIIS